MTCHLLDNCIHLNNPNPVSSSAPRVMLLMQLLHALAGYVGVYLGCGEVAVTKQQLYHTQVGTMVEQVCGKGVTQRMG